MELLVCMISKEQLRQIADEACKTHPITKLPPKRIPRPTGDSISVFKGSVLYDQAIALGFKGRP
jgi:hypothetical protein